MQPAFYECRKTAANNRRKSRALTAVSAAAGDHDPGDHGAPQRPRDGVVERGELNADAGAVAHVREQSEQKERGEERAERPADCHLYLWCEFNVGLG